jgi:hypothetical protein
LKEISECIRESSVEKENEMMAIQNCSIAQANLKKLMEKKEKRVSKLIYEPKNESLVPKTLILKQEDNKAQIKDAIVKYQKMKKVISTAGIKGESSRNETLDRA